MDSTPQGATLKKVPLEGRHRAAGAVFTGFGGWDLPVRFTSILEEHEAVRSRAGLFDISHMGQIELRGPKALDLIQGWVCSDMADLAQGRCRYTLALTEEGGVRDDLIIYRLGAESFFIVLNAAQEEFHLADLKARGGSGVEMENLHPGRVKFDLQGPAAPRILDSILGPQARDEKGGRLLDLKYFGFGLFPWLGTRILISRTGYTGELGYEIYLPKAKGEEAWALLAGGASGLSVLPCGLGARDTLRLEAAYPLAGHELHPGVRPEEAGQEARVSTSKPAFTGREAWLARKEKEPPRRQLGLKVQGGIPRDGCKIYRNGKESGLVSSGTFSPSLKTGIALAFLAGNAPGPQDKFTCEIRGRQVEASLEETPFYKKGSARAKLTKEGSIQ